MEPPRGPHPTRIEENQVLPEGAEQVQETIAKKKNSLMLNQPA